MVATQMHLHSATRSLQAKVMAALGAWEESVVATMDLDQASQVDPLGVVESQAERWRNM